MATSFDELIPNTLMPDTFLGQIRRLQEAGALPREVESNTPPSVLMPPATVPPTEEPRPTYSMAGLRDAAGKPIPLPPDTPDITAFSAPERAAQLGTALRSIQNRVALDAMDRKEQKWRGDFEQRRFDDLIGSASPADALAALLKQQQLRSPSQTGSAEAMAFREVLRTQGLPAALSWLQQSNTEAQKLSPFERVMQETRARFGPEAQGLRAAAAGGVAQAQQDVRQGPTRLLTPDQVQKFGVPMGTTWGDLVNAGKPLTSPTQRAGLHELDTGRYMLEHIATLSKELFTDSDWKMAYAQSFPIPGTLRFGAMTGSNPKARLYDQQRQALLGILSRQIGAERGVLTDRDITRLATALPYWGDTDAVANQKVDFLRGMFDANTGARQQALQNFELTYGKLGEGEVVQSFGPPQAGAAPTGQPGGLSYARQGEEVRYEGGRAYVLRNGRLTEVRQ